eukprot:TRINITY_DN22372_c1_g1_i1.p1 TRINITY_DN22372_c1_g1~~TRINITY_DN22372_c1_g1_i1.p1  ORF type:complete len:501 (-),score=90.13 TRINITY_DN22372_c1_g1_i1:82-1533(-)
MAPSPKEEASTVASSTGDSATDAGPAVGWGFWTTLCIMCVAGLLVNQLEAPFARTLISCDTPIGEPLNNTGSILSTKCSDRILVIGAGARLSARAQSFEHFCKIFMALLVANIANICGRKPLILLAVGSVWLSVFLFILASTFDGVAPWLFIVAQGIQGLATGDMLVNIVFADLAMKMGSRGPELYVKKDQVLGLVMLLTFLSSQLIASLELLDYRLLWTLVFCLLSCGLYICARYFPESMTKKEEASTQLSLSQQLVDELVLYKTMFVEKPMVCWSLMDGFLSGIAQDSAAPMWAPFMMAYFGYTQQQLVLRMFPVTILTEASKGLANSHCRKVGYTRGFWHTMIGLKCAGFTFMPLCVVCWWMPWLTKVIYMPLIGFNPIWFSVRARVVGEKMMPKLESLLFLVWCGAQAIGSQVHVMIFDEHASTIWARFMSSAWFPAFFNLLAAALFIFKVYPACGEVLASMDAEMAADKANQDSKKKE